MRTPDPNRRPAGRFVRLALAALCVTLLGGVLAGCESTKPELDAVRNDINQSRIDAGLAPLVENVVLDMKADQWAQALRDQCRIWHSRLADGAPPEWMKLGENVGMGGNIDQVHVAYMNSPGHKANILDPKFSAIGTAAVWGDCNGYHTVFTVQEFMSS
jgi:uncharacterized protein YkwD